MARPVLSPPVIALVIVGILACSAFVYFQIVRGVADMPPPDPLLDQGPVEGPPPPAPAPEPEIDIPPLEESDEAVRLLVGTLSSHPRLAAWLAPDDLVRRFVAAVDNVANEESPRPHLGHLKPGQGFRVEEEQGELIVDPASHRRYDLLVEAFNSLDTAAGVELYERMKPLFDEAYRELGYPGGDFDRALATAIDRVLAAPVPDGAVAVKRRVTTYRYADPELEALSPVEKHLLRLGPTNARKVQAKLQRMRDALALPE